MTTMACNTSTRKVRTIPPFDHLFNSFFNTAIGDLLYTPSTKKDVTRPSTNVRSLDDKFILDLALPGLSKEDVHISVDKDLLTVSDRRVKRDEEVSFRLREFNYEGFKKSFHLSEEIDTDHISAVFSDGILSITLHKKEEAKPVAVKTINIQ